MTSFTIVTLFTTILAFSTALALPASHETSSTINSYAIPGNITYPEGIARQPNSPYFYTGSTTDGTIYRGDIRKPEVEVFIPPNADGTSLPAAGMKVDCLGRLFIANGLAGVLSVYDIDSRELLHRFKSRYNGTLVNDLAIAADGTVYATDTFLPVLYHIPPSMFHGAIDQELKVFINQTGFTGGNGIVVTPDQHYLIVGDWYSRDLYRVYLKTKSVNKIDLGGKTIGSPDGMLIRDSTLYSVNSNYTLGMFIDVIEIRKPYLSATPLFQIKSPLFTGPSTAAFDGGDLLVVNFQFGLPPPAPQLPFNIVRVPSY